MKEEFKIIAATILFIFSATEPPNANITEEGKEILEGATKFLKEQFPK